ncbi:Uncharacterized protein Adt_06191 [Abeliophyllum distichum]|uniref:Integrase zinc-binding domain-containing protein n=1 Tax=Abeliophyllum distichum TaxID=126358 RepID=A0ABD1V685_9LAMI
MPQHALGRTSGEECTSALLQRAYYWPQMRDDISAYVKTYLVCQQDKPDHQKNADLLEPLPVPTRPFKSVSMDYIVSLPKVGDLRHYHHRGRPFIKICNIYCNT